MVTEFQLSDSLRLQCHVKICRNKYVEELWQPSNNKQNFYQRKRNIIVTNLTKLALECLRSSILN